MPHLIIEHSSNLSAFPSAEILPALNKSLTASTEIKDETDLKTRVIAVDDFRIGNQAGGRAFVHAELAERVAVVLRQSLPRPAGLDVQLSVDIVDMDRGSYVKERLAQG